MVLNARISENFTATIFLIHDASVVADAICSALQAQTNETLDVVHVTTREAGMSRLRNLAAQPESADDELDAVLLQWQSADALDGSALDLLIGAAANIPVLVLCSVEDAVAAQLTAPHGTQEYYVHTTLDESLLPRTVKRLLAHARATNELFDEKERAQLTLNSIGDAVMSIDVEHRVKFLNRAAERLTGWTHASAVGRNFNEVFQIVDADNGASVVNPLTLALRNDAACKLPPNCNLLRPDQSEVGIEDSAAPIHNRRGQVTGAVIVFRDVSEARASAKRLSFLAQHDALTGLPNRTVLQDRLNQSISLASRSGGSFALMFIDVDRFKHINDALGHTAGDAVLRTLARRLAATVRASDTVSRHGGDEFVVLLPTLGKSMDAGVCAKKLLEVARLPVIHNQTEIEVTASAGIAIFPQDGADADALIQSADSAMFHAKLRGRNTYQFYSSDFKTGASERLIIESDLRHAVERDQLVLHYQPKVKLATREFIGFEALLRWNHPRRGLIRPLEFIALAEETGLIIPIGRWVLREACRQAVRWGRGLSSPVRMAVNVSALELRTPDYANGIKEALAETGMDPTALELEITETCLLQDSTTTSRTLCDLKDLGVSLALDDFGTGYSSLSFIRRFPIDVLKVDHSFMRDVTSNTQDACVVSAIIHMGRSMHMGVVAEGIESEAQLQFLVDNGCSEGQGYYFSPPQPASALTYAYDHMPPGVGAMTA